MTHKQNRLRLRWAYSSALITLIAGLCLAGFAAEARAQSGQTAFGQATVEPAVNYADGSTIFLLTPDKSPFPSKANPRAWAPMYLVMYPSNSSIDPGVLNCQPGNCDHANVLPFPTPAYPTDTATCEKYAFGANACGLVIGHDHLVGKAPTGDFNVAWHVILVVFTPKGAGDGAVNSRIMTLTDLGNAETNGDAVEVPSNIIFNCSIVSSVVYYKGVPLTGF